MKKRKQPTHCLRPLASKRESSPVEGEEKPLRSPSSFPEGVKEKRRISKDENEDAKAWKEGEGKKRKKRRKKQRRGDEEDVEGEGSSSKTPSIQVTITTTKRRRRKPSAKQLSTEEEAAPSSTSAFPPPLSSSSSSSTPSITIKREEKSGGVICVPKRTPGSLFPSPPVVRFIFHAKEKKPMEIEGEHREDTEQEKVGHWNTREREEKVEALPQQFPSLPSTGAAFRRSSEEGVSSPFQEPLRAYLSTQNSLSSLCRSACSSSSLSSSRTSVHASSPSSSSVQSRDRMSSPSLSFLPSAIDKVSHSDSVSSSALATLWTVASYGASHNRQHEGTEKSTPQSTTWSAKREKRGERASNTPLSHVSAKEMPKAMNLAPLFPSTTSASSFSSLLHPAFKGHSSDVAVPHEGDEVVSDHRRTTEKKNPVKPLRNSATARDEHCQREKRSVKEEKHETQEITVRTIEIGGKGEEEKERAGIQRGMDRTATGGRSQEQGKGNTSHMDTSGAEVKERAVTVQTLWNQEKDHRRSPRSSVRVATEHENHKRREEEWDGKEGRTPRSPTTQEVEPNGIAVPNPRSCVDASPSFRSSSTSSASKPATLAHRNTMDTIPRPSHPDPTHTHVTSDPTPLPFPPMLYLSPTPVPNPIHRASPVVEEATESAPAPPPSQKGVEDSEKEHSSGSPFMAQSVTPPPQGGPLHQHVEAMLLSCTHSPDEVLQFIQSCVFTRGLTPTLVVEELRELLLGMQEGKRATPSALASSSCLSSPIHLTTRVEHSTVERVREGEEEQDVQEEEKVYLTVDKEEKEKERMEVTHPMPSSLSLEGHRDRTREMEDTVPPVYPASLRSSRCEKTQMTKEKKKPHDALLQAGDMKVPISFHVPAATIDAKAFCVDLTSAIPITTAEDGRVTCASLPYSSSETLMASPHATGQPEQILGSGAFSSSTRPSEKLAHIGEWYREQRKALLYPPPPSSSSSNETSDEEWTTLHAPHHRRGRRCHSPTARQQSWKRHTRRSFYTEKMLGTRSCSPLPPRQGEEVGCPTSVSSVRGTGAVVQATLAVPFYASTHHLQPCHDNTKGEVVQNGNTVDAVSRDVARDGGGSSALLCRSYSTSERKPGSSTITTMKTTSTTRTTKITTFCTPPPAVAARSSRSFSPPHREEKDTHKEKRRGKSSGKNNRHHQHQQRSPPNHQSRRETYRRSCVPRLTFCHIKKSRRRSSSSTSSTSSSSSCGASSASTTSIENSHQKGWRGQRHGPLRSTRARRSCGKGKHHPHGSSSSLRYSRIHALERLRYSWKSTTQRETETKEAQKEPGDEGKASNSTLVDISLVSTTLPAKAPLPSPVMPRSLKECRPGASFTEHGATTSTSSGSTLVVENHLPRSSQDLSSSFTGSIGSVVPPDSTTAASLPSLPPPPPSPLRPPSAIRGTVDPPPMIPMLTGATTIPVSSSLSSIPKKVHVMTRSPLSTSTLIGEKKSPSLVMPFNTIENLENTAPPSKAEKAGETPLKSPQGSHASSRPPSGNHLWDNCNLLVLPTPPATASSGVCEDLQYYLHRSQEALKESKHLLSLMTDEKEGNKKESTMDDSSGEKEEESKKEGKELR